ncbi:MAG TPA: peptide chain release factor-like protein [Gemmatales bacterium]|nr:peptide chain release factor-like protein [Gemmatales bacterium]
MTLNRSAFVELSDAQLLAQCAVDTYRASGPGGQKRNKTSSAVRLRHEPTGLMVIAEESRSQHENKAKALRRLRQRLFLSLRQPPPPQALGLLALKVGRRDERFWPTVAQVLDIWWAVEGQLATAAQQIGVSSGQLLAFLQREPTLWTQANLARREFGHKPLRAT